MFGSHRPAGVVGAPSYLERHGILQKPADLLQHDCICMRWASTNNFESTIADELSRCQLRVVLEQYAPEVPGLFLYFPSRAQVSPALKAFVDVARQVMNESKTAK